MAQRKPPQPPPSVEQLLSRAYAALEDSHNYLVNFRRQQNDFDKREKSFRRAIPTIFIAKQPGREDR